MAFVDVAQLSSDWLIMHCGCPSASDAWKVMAKLKRQQCATCGESKSAPAHKAAHAFVPKDVEAAARLTYRKRKVMEMLTGRVANTFVSSYMEAGLDVEELARAAYEQDRDVEVLHGGLFIHDSISRFIASPDGRIGDDGLLEAKYLTGETTEANHLDLLRGAPIPEEYQWQMLGQLSCSGRQWVDFVSYQPPPMPKKLRLLVRRFHRDEKRIAELEQGVISFLSEVDDELAQLNQDDPSSLVGPLTRSVEAANAGLAGD